MKSEKPLVFATGNPNKIKEVNELLGDSLPIIGLKDINCPTDLPETTHTIPGNALQKARYVYQHYQMNCFSEDTGLEIDALNGEPGVHTAYYGGMERDAAKNMALVLNKLGDSTERGAQFRTVIALILDGTEHLFEGIVRGRIGYVPKGNDGFGYDPIFIPEGYDTTFAEMDATAKNAISHRGRAVRKLVNFLKQL